MAGADLARFLQIAAGSASETANHLLLARDLGMLDDEQSHCPMRELTEIRRMLTALIKKVRTSQDRLSHH